MATNENPQGHQKQVQEEETTQVSIEYNLRFYNQGCEVPSDALKPIRAGRLKGMSDVNPMWRMRRLTEIFGPVGFGWKYEITRQWTEELVHSKTNTDTPNMQGVRPTYNENGEQTSLGFLPVTGSETESFVREIKCFCNLNLYIRDPKTKEWSEAIPGTGGSTLIAKENNGMYFNDEGYKMALTDALSIAMKAIGIGGNIWYGPKASGHNESKYEDGTREQPQKRNYGEMMTDAVAEMKAVTTERGFKDVWTKWANGCPAICNNTTDFYKAACDKRQELNNATK